MTTQVAREKTLEEQEKEVKDDIIKLAQQKDLLIQDHLSYLLAGVLEQIMSTVSRLPAYPQRTLLPPTPSPYFLVLKEVLAKAPFSESLNRSSLMGLYVHEDERRQLNFRWTNTFVNKVAQALIHLIYAHGLGDGGWRSAQWMVYDAWTSSIGGVDWNTYTDKGLFWLVGRVPDPDIRFLPLVTGEGLETWLELNTMLPQQGQA